MNSLTLFCEDCCFARHFAIRAVLGLIWEAEDLLRQKVESRSRTVLKGVQYAIGSLCLSSLP